VSAEAAEARVGGSHLTLDKGCRDGVPSLTVSDDDDPSAPTSNKNDDVNLASMHQHAVMETAVTAISAIAASAAATLAALNLVVSGRREHTKWARDTLIEVFSSFVDLSFESKDLVKRAVRQGGIENWPLDADAVVRAEARDTERQMREMQSRLRLLAGPEVIDAAQRLRLAVREYYTLLDAELEVALARDADMRRDCGTSGRTSSTVPRWLWHCHAHGEERPARRRRRQWWAIRKIARSSVAVGSPGAQYAHSA
jgi:hypothetical protein